MAELNPEKEHKIPTRSTKSGSRGAKSRCEAQNPEWKREIPNESTKSVKLSTKSVL